MEQIYLRRKKIPTEEYILRLGTGEEFITTILDFCEEKEIKAAWFVGIGAIRKAKLGIYNPIKKDYDFQIINDFHEILTLKGNVGTQNEKLVSHTHAVLAKNEKSEIKLTGGHVHQLEIEGTCEVRLTVFDTEFKRIRGSGKGLRLLHPEV